jgi:glycosyltransferase involved in cell wall biosynthesis
MRQSDIFLFPSRLEGFGKVTLEAAATGLPAIVFQDYDTPVVRDGVTGFQVHTLEEMLDRLGKLIADSDMRKEMGLAARRHAEQFDWEIVSRHWEDAYWQIAAGH